jgi:hypothetical protein
VAEQSVKQRVLEAIEALPEVTRVIWTRQAAEDVEAIKAYVARDSERYATVSSIASRLTRSK